MESISIAELKSALPDKLKKNVSPQVMHKVNEVLGDPEVYETYRENLLGYAHVLREGRFKMTNYIDAVKFVSYKLMGKTSKDSFLLVFPEKIKAWTDDGVEGKDQASYISAYNNSKLVSLIYEQTLIPIHVLNRDNYQRAINVQVELMLCAKSELVRTQAANSVMTHLKQPDKTRIDVSVSSESDSAIEALTASTQALIEQQKAMMSTGAINAQEAAHQTIQVIDDGEFSEILDTSLPEPAQLPVAPKPSNPEKGLFD